MEAILQNPYYLVSAVAGNCSGGIYRRSNHIFAERLETWEESSQREDGR